MPCILMILLRGRGSAKPWMTSSLTRSLSRSGFVVAPLWFPKVRASSTSLILSSSLISANGQIDPLFRRFLNLSLFGWRFKSFLSNSVVLNSDPYPSGESCFAPSAFPRSLSNLFITQ